MSKKPDPHTLQFNGPAELSDAWTKAITVYAGDVADAVKSANMLNDLLFKPNGLKQFSRRYNTKNGQYAMARGHIERICEKLSDAAADEECLPLVKEINKNLIAQWIGLERAHGLYPPVPVLGTPDARQEVKARRHIFKKRPDATLLYGALHMTLSNSIDGMINATYNDFKQNPKNEVDIAVIQAIADKIFNDALFSYRDDKGASIHTYVIKYLGDNLKSKVNKERKRQSHHLSLDEEVESGSLRIDFIADPKSERPDDIVARNEHKTRLRDRLTAVLAGLPKIQRKIVELRYFKDLQPTDMARETGLAVHQVNGHLDKARRTLRKKLASLNPVPETRSTEVPAAEEPVFSPPRTEALPSDFSSRATMQRLTLSEAAAQLGLSAQELKSVRDSVIRREDGQPDIVTLTIKDRPVSAIVQGDEFIIRLSALEPLLHTAAKHHR